MITAANRRGLNSVLRHLKAICFKSSRTPRSTEYYVHKTKKISCMINFQIDSSLTERNNPN